MDTGTAFGLGSVAIFLVFATSTIIVSMLIKDAPVIEDDCDCDWSEPCKCKESKVEKIENHLL